MFTLKNKLTALTLLSIFILSFSACEDDDTQPAETMVNYKFEHYVDGAPANFNEIMYTNAYGNEYSVETLKYFLSKIKLTFADGTAFTVDQAFYIDAFDESTTTTGYTSLISGEYASISMIFGLDEEMNVPGAFPNAPENNMEWPAAMGSGYHYMKLEGKVDNDTTTNNYQAHTGPTMNNQNYIEITLPDSEVTLSGNAVTITIRMNIEQWWETPNTLDLNTVTGIMGNQEMQLKLRANGQDVFSFEGVEFPL